MQTRLQTPIRLQLSFIFFASCRYKRVVGQLMHARMYYFDITPTGRILNHMSSDTSTIDEQLPQVHMNHHVHSITTTATFMCLEEKTRLN